MSKIVISNATPIISLCSVHHEHILKELFNHIVIPEAVENELRVLERPGSDFSDNSWVEVEAVKNEDLIHLLMKDLDRGESETIALAKQRKADIVIIDEIAGYQIAKHFDLPVVRTLSVLKTAKELGIIEKVAPLLSEMVQKGRWYSIDVIDKFLRIVGE
jgi:predicted nucleic acid-binding protein